MMKSKSAVALLAIAAGFGWTGPEAYIPNDDPDNRKRSPRGSRFEELLPRPALRRVAQGRKLREKHTCTECFGLGYITHGTHENPREEECVPCDGRGTNDRYERHAVHLRRFESIGRCV